MAIAIDGSSADAHPEEESSSDSETEEMQSKNATTKYAPAPPPAYSHFIAPECCLRTLRNLILITCLCAQIKDENCQVLTLITGDFMYHSQNAMPQVTLYASSHQGINSYQSSVY